MKILEIISSLDVGGAEKALAARLAHQPDNVETTVLHGPARTDKQVVLPEKTLRIEASISRNSIKSVIQQTIPNAVVIHNPLNLIRYPKVRQTYTTPSVLYVSHAAVLSERAWQRRMLFLPFRRSLSKTSGIIAVSKQAMSTIGARHPVEVLHLGSALSENPIEENQLPNFDWLQDARIRFIVLSRLSSTKNLRSVLGAVSLIRREFRESKARLLIVGDGPEKTRLANSVTKLGISDLVRMSPSTNAPAQFLLNSDFLVISSISEGGPLTAVEALIAGCNLITTPVGFIPDLMEKFPGHVTLITGTQEKDVADAFELALSRTHQSGFPKLLVEPENFEFSTDTCSKRFYETILKLKQRS